MYVGLILGLHPTSEKRRYFAMTTHICWVQASCLHEFHQQCWLYYISDMASCLILVHYIELAEL